MSALLKDNGYSTTCVIEKYELNTNIKALSKNTTPQVVALKNEMVQLLKQVSANDYLEALMDESSSQLNARYYLKKADIYKRLGQVTNTEKLLLNLEEEIIKSASKKSWYMTEGTVSFINKIQKIEREALTPRAARKAAKELYNNRSFLSIDLPRSFKRFGLFSVLVVGGVMLAEAMNVNDNGQSRVKDY